MVAAVAALAHGGAAEFAGPDDESVVEHAALFQVGDQRHAGAIDFLGFVADAFLDAAVVVPIFVVKLDETDAAFGETAGEEAIGRERTVARLATVEVHDALRLLGDLHEFGDARLHLESHFVLGDAGGDFGIVDDLCRI